MKPFLICYTDAICYDSYLYFAENFAAALRGLHCETELFAIHKDHPESLEALLGRDYSAVVDFNSALPRAKLEDGSYFLDQIDAPFIDIILDHPLYHHDSLKHTLDRFHAFCLDRNHRNYILDQYPHIKSCSTIFMTGEPGKVIPVAEKKFPLFFSGSFTETAQVVHAIEESPPFLADLTWDMIEAMQAAPEKTLEACLRTKLPELDEIVGELFPLHVQSCFLADTYLRAFRRETLLTELAENGLPLTVCGSGWEDASFYSKKNVTTLRPVPFRDSMELFSNSRIVLNVMPGFLDGAHDRIYASMLRHSVCLTDPSILLKEELEHKRTVMFYDPLVPGSLSQTASELLSDDALCESISENGSLYAKKSHTWKNCADSFLSFYLTSIQ